MRTCKTCKHLIYPTMMGYACKKRGLWGTDIPLFFDSPCECKKWKQRIGKDDANRAFVPAKPLPTGIFYVGKHRVTFVKGK